MKNLENYGVLELNSQEIRSIEGGWPWPDLLEIIDYYMEYVGEVDYIPGHNGYMGCKL